jgi:hypothetical protein
VSTDIETSIARGFLGNHTYSCALPVRGGVCDCQSDHDPSTDPWPYLSTGRNRQMRGGSASPRPGGVDVRFEAGLGGMPAEHGMGLVGIVSLVDQDPNGPIDR